MFAFYKASVLLLANVIQIIFTKMFIYNSVTFCYIIIYCMLPGMHQSFTGHIYVMSMILLHIQVNINSIIVRGAGRPWQVGDCVSIRARLEIRNYWLLKLPDNDWYKLVIAWLTKYFTHIASFLLVNVMFM